MNIDVLFVAGLAMIALGLIVRRFVDGIIALIMAIVMAYGVFVVLGHTFVPYAITTTAQSVPVGPEVIAGAILIVTGLAIHAGVKRGPRAVFAPVYTTMGVFAVLVNLAIPYITSLSDWSTTLST